MPARTRFRVSSLPRKSRVTARRNLGSNSSPIAQSQEFGEIGDLAPALVINVLLAMPIIATGHLQMPIGGPANPHVRPRGRYRQRLDPLQRAWVAKSYSPSTGIAKTVAIAAPRKAGLLVADVLQLGQSRQLLGRKCFNGQILATHGEWAAAGRRFPTDELSRCAARCRSCTNSLRIWSRSAFSGARRMAEG